MEMTIEEEIDELEYLKIQNSQLVSLDVAIETMRKYQKIKNIICKWEDGLFDDEGLLDTEVLEMISDEVNGDGKDNN